MNTFFTTLAIAIPAVYFAKQHFHGPACSVPKPDMTGKIVVITGASDGIGKATARDIAQQKATIIFACRNEEKTKKVIDEIKRASKNDRLEFMPCDLNDLDSVRDFASRLRAKYGSRLDVLIENAGVADLAGDPKPTKQGHEQTFGVNYLGHFLLTQLLEDVLQQTPQSRVVVVSSRLHERVRGEDFSVDALGRDTPRGVREVGLAYARSKLCQMLFVERLKTRLRADTTKVVAVSPGLVRTNLFAGLRQSIGVFADVLQFALYPLLWIVSRNEIEGAQTTLHCVYENWDTLRNGLYYHNCAERRASPLTQDKTLVDALWDKSVKLVAGKA